MVVVQLLEQVPQAVRSVCRFLQVPEQSVCPVGQVQTPLTQDLPPEQTLPQLPQLLLSVALFLQPLLQQRPLLPKLLAQLFPQLPQLAESFV